MRKNPALGLAVLAAVVGVGVFAARGASARRRAGECRALASALDKTVRAKSARIVEGIVEHRYDRSSRRCLAALEYHYRPCDAKQRKSAPLLCAGPDADIAIYAFKDAAVRPLIICERRYETGSADCAESVYGDDGSLLSSREIPPDEFPRLKAALMRPGAG